MSLSNGEGLTLPGNLGGGGASDFTDLTDTPNSYTSQALKGLRVNAGATALEFVDLVDDFLGLSDTPSSYSGQAGLFTRVNSGETALEFVDLQPQLVQAWVNFDGTGTVSIRDSYNVTSITDNGVGDYTANYTTSLGNTTYCPLVSRNGGTSSNTFTAVFDDTLSATSTTIYTKFNTGQGDATTVTLMVLSS